MKNDSDSSQTPKIPQQNVDKSKDNKGVMKMEEKAAKKWSVEELNYKSAEAFIQKLSHRLLLKRLQSIENSHQMLEKGL
ncbi:hypothetical protein J1N35_018232 [Gossypium stocksii]|uniref:Uncharacterized protein n=1 Tax=Gossypium stocksii TaxID=47602 RepID=A0A9D3VQ92_9ROSI|nr:hypothetical protein J1N35_018232 [Gossypium stocksii]